MTNSSRYYQPSEVPPPTRHLKLAVGGHALPPSQPVPKCVNQSYASLREMWTRLRERVGMRTLVYGTLEEFGIGVVQPTESIARVCDMGSNRSASADDKYAARLACGANRLMRDRFPNAPLVDPTKDSAVDAGWQRGSWDSVIMDFGDPSYADFQVNADPSSSARYPILS